MKLLILIASSLFLTSCGPKKKDCSPSIEAFHKCASKVVDQITCADIQNQEPNQMGITPIQHIFVSKTSECRTKLVSFSEPVKCMKDLQIKEDVLKNKLREKCPALVQQPATPATPTPGTPNAPQPSASPAPTPAPAPTGSPQPTTGTPQSPAPTPAPTSG